MNSKSQKERDRQADALRQRLWKAIADAKTTHTALSLAIERSAGFLRDFLCPQKGGQPPKKHSLKSADLEKIEKELGLPGGYFSAKWPIIHESQKPAASPRQPVHPQKKAARSHVTAHRDFDQQISSGQGIQPTGTTDIVAARREDLIALVEKTIDAVTKLQSLEFDISADRAFRAIVVAKLVNSYGAPHDARSSERRDNLQTQIEFEVRNILEEVLHGSSRKP
jgi:hypothetical protein